MSPAGYVDLPDLVHRLADRDATRTEANRANITGEQVSEYASRFTQGATMVPRFMLFVEPLAAPPLGAGAGRKFVRSRRNVNEDKRWKGRPSLQGAVELQFLWHTHLGETILPYRPLTPLDAIVPWDGHRLLSGTDDRFDLYPGLAAWWHEAEAVWEAGRSNDKLS